jgi:glutathione peroxidase
VLRAVGRRALASFQAGFFAGGSKVMRKTVLSLLGVALLLGSSVNVRADEKKDGKVPDVLNFKMKSLAGEEVDLSKYKGKVVMFVNVASKCGLTPQYKGLEALHEKYEKDGLVVIGVPANEFNGQEPGTDAEISKFCTTKYGVKFPMMSKVVVKGDGIAPLYQYLTSKETDPKFSGEIAWNFTKFLVGRDGKVVARFEPRVKPDSTEVTKAIEAELKK